MSGVVIAAVVFIAFLAVVFIVKKLLKIGILFAVLAILILAFYKLMQI
jgi:hypothetical protein